MLKSLQIWPMLKPRLLNYLWERILPQGFVNSIDLGDDNYLELLSVDYNLKSEIGLRPISAINKNKSKIKMNLTDTSKYKWFRNKGIK